MNTTRLVSSICAVFLLLFSMPQCAQKQPQSPATPPREVMGVSLGMDKDAATRRLAELGKKQSEDRKTGELWRLRDKSKLDAVAVGYDKSNKIRFITAFVDKATAKERTRYTDIGDITKARQEIVKPHYRYTWQIPESSGDPAYSVVADGEDPEYLSFYAIGKNQSSDEDEEEREDRDADKDSSNNSDKDKDRDSRKDKDKK